MLKRCALACVTGQHAHIGCVDASTTHAAACLHSSDTHPERPHAANAPPTQQAAGPAPGGSAAARRRGRCVCAAGRL
jgi:hypothetical protein